MTEKNILPACSITVSIPVKIWRFNMAFEVTSATALGTSADGVLIPTAMVKAMPVFRYFDYGHSAECAQGKKGDPSTPCIIVVYPRDI